MVWTANIVSVLDAILDTYYPAFQMSSKCYGLVNCVAKAIIYDSRRESPQVPYLPMWNIPNILESPVHSHYSDISMLTFLETKNVGILYYLCQLHHLNDDILRAHNFICAAINNHKTLLTLYPPTYGSPYPFPFSPSPIPLNASKSNKI